MFNFKDSLLCYCLTFSLVTLCIVSITVQLCVTVTVNEASVFPTSQVFTVGILIAC
jgi:hypothetical protein